MDLFGNADGGSEDTQGFVHFEDQWGDLALRANDRRVRVLVGRRGSGKSRYLRALEREVGHADAERMLVFPQRDDSVSIEELRWLHRAYADPDERVEVWRKLWGCAVWLSLASFLAHSRPPPGSSMNISIDDRAYLERICARHLGPTSVSCPIVTALNQLLFRYRNRGRLHGMTSHPEWIEVEHRVTRAVAASTPIACYIDTLDETFSASPAAATDCQVGLLHWIFRKTNDPNVTNRIHVVVAIRETVFASLMRGEHAQRYDRNKSIRCLDWNEETARIFLETKARNLPANACARPKEHDPVRAWLGFTEVANGMREGRVEKVSDLIIRHTRFLPREIIVIGNAVGRYVAAQVAGRHPVKPETVVSLVMNEAHQLSEAALHTATDHIVALDADYDRAAAANGFRDDLIKAINGAFIPTLREERFDSETLQLAELAFAEAIGWVPGDSGVPLSQVLWLHGLIGYEDTSGPKPVAKYFSSTKTLKSNLSARLPEAEHYYLHSALLRPDRTRIGEQPPIVEALPGGLPG